ncbi:MAG: hypothetical protein IKQ82_01840 [Lentisphaeria bacterium]|nr:hypothetical protein [Lentisphaeria bacterium]
MARLYSYFVDEPLFAILTVIGIVVSVLLFVLFYRNRKQDQLTRRRFLLLSVLTPVHTVLLPLVFLLETEILALLWFFLVPFLFFVQILYLFYLRKWENRDLRTATTAFAFYNVYLFFLTFLTFFAMAH